MYARTVMGRKLADVLVSDINVSSKHLAIEFSGKSFRVVDLQSSNGIFMNGKQIREARLNFDEEVHFGNSAFRIITDHETAAKIRKKNPLQAGWTEGGMTDLIRREFLQADAQQEDAQVAESPTEQSGNYKLTVISGPDRGKHFLMKKEKAVIGRVNADINLADVDISRKHALLERQEDQRILLHDLASTNGTYVNERKVSNALLKDGDQIRLGQSVLTFSIVGS